MRIQSHKIPPYAQRNEYLATVRKNNRTSLSRRSISIVNNLEFGTIYRCCVMHRWQSNAHKCNRGSYRDNNNTTSTQSL